MSRESALCGLQLGSFFELLRFEQRAHKLAHSFRAMESTEVLLFSMFFDHKHSRAATR
jgi:hypothetical protein